MPSERRRMCSSKRRYPTAIQAGMALVKIRTISTRSVIPERIYECPYCAGFHLTHLPHYEPEMTA